MAYATYPSGNWLDRPRQIVRLVVGHAKPTLAQTDVSGPLTKEITETERRILGFVRPADWDGDGSPGISAAACRTAASIARSVFLVAPELGAPRSSPSTVRGAVSLTWRKEGQSLTLFVSKGSQRRFECQCVTDDYQARSCTLDLTGVLNALLSA
jgi:hypothetical protein